MGLQLGELSADPPAEVGSFGGDCFGGVGAGVSGSVVVGVWLVRRLFE